MLSESHGTQIEGEKQGTAHLFISKDDSEGIGCGTVSGLRASCNGARASSCRQGDCSDWLSLQSCLDSITVCSQGVRVK